LEHLFRTVGARAWTFDYWHYLGIGVRRAAVTRTAELATVLKGIVANA